MNKLLPVANIALVVLIFFGALIGSAHAQGGTPTPTPDSQNGDPPPDDNPIPLVHIVQEGETLFSIAESYETTVETLLLLNDIADPALIQIGQEILIPGGEGDLVAAVYTVQVGDSILDLAAGFNTGVPAIAAANRLIHPGNLVAGQTLTIFSRTGTAEPQPLSGRPYLVEAGDTLLTIAAGNNLNPFVLASANNLSYPAYLYPGQRLRLPGEGGYQFLPGPIKTLTLYPVPITQGDTVAIYVESLETGKPAGRFGDKDLRFSPYENGYLALIGVDAFTEPDRYRLEITIADWPPFRQDVAIVSGGYSTSYITIPEEAAPLLDPAIRANDEALMAPIYTSFSEPRQWDGLFQVPVSNTVITAGYGDARSYNEGPIEIFHTGVDFAGPVGTPIRAPAAGTVVFTETLALFGNTLIIDHGLGVMTGYYHLSEVLVSVGESVNAGQIVARGGSTGLSSGPHLHWDLRVGNEPVNALLWTEEDIALEILGRDDSNEPETSSEG